MPLKVGTENLLDCVCFMSFTLSLISQAYIYTKRCSVDIHIWSLKDSDCNPCISVLGSFCSYTVNCTRRGDENSICMNGTCSCTYGYFTNSTRNKCQLSKHENSSLNVAMHGS